MRLHICREIRSSSTSESAMLRCKASSSPEWTSLIGSNEGRSLSSFHDQYLQHCDQSFVIYFKGFNSKWLIYLRSNNIFSTGEADLKHPKPHTYTSSLDWNYIGNKKFLLERTKRVTFLFVHLRLAVLCDPREADWSDHRVNLKIINNPSPKSVTQSKKMF